MLGMILKPLAEKLKIWFNLLDFGESLDLSGHLLSFDYTCNTVLTLDPVIKMSPEYITVIPILS